MTAEASLLVDTVELRRHTGTRRDFGHDVELDDLSAGERTVVDGRLHVDAVIEAVTEGIVVRGTATGTWRMPCRRCLEPTDGPLSVDIHEVFEAQPTEGETWPIDDERIDLEPVLREAALLALPLVPLCREDCPGPEPSRFPTGPPEEPGTQADPRWAALDDLTFDD